MAGQSRRTAANAGRRYRQKAAVVTKPAEGGAYSAAVLARVGRGHWGSPDEAAEATRITGTTQPSAPVVPTYDRLHPVPPRASEWYGVLS